MARSSRGEGRGRLRDRDWKSFALPLSSVTMPAPQQRSKVGTKNPSGTLISVTAPRLGDCYHDRATKCLRRPTESLFTRRHEESAGSFPRREATFGLRRKVHDDPAPIPGEYEPTRQARQRTEVATDRSFPGSERPTAPSPRV